MRLLLDIGNTAMKWRCRDGDQVQQGDAVHGRDWLQLVRSEAIPWSEVSRIDVASVAGRDADQQLARAIASRTPVTPAFYYSCAADCGVRNAYQEPARLGVDRWLAVIEAWHRYGPAIIVDFGSALTLDAVDSAGLHRGGYIVPGLGMLERSLIQGTGSVRVSAEPAPDSLAPGCSTSEGVRHGILRMTVAFVTDAVVALREGLPDTAPVLLTGGDAARVAALLPWRAELAPDLVLDGLERVTAR